MINHIPSPTIAAFADGYRRNFSVIVIEDVSETNGVIEPFKYERSFSRSREMLSYFDKMQTKKYVMALYSYDKSERHHNMFNEKHYINPKYKNYDYSRYFAC